MTTDAYTVSEFSFSLCQTIRYEHTASSGGIGYPHQCMYMCIKYCRIIVVLAASHFLLPAFLALALT